MSNKTAENRTWTIVCCGQPTSERHAYKSLTFECRICWNFAGMVDTATAEQQLAHFERTRHSRIRGYKEQAELATKRLVALETANPYVGTLEEKPK